MKPLLIISILLLSGCTQYRYDVTYEKCNGQTGSITAIGDGMGCTQGAFLDNYKLAIPVLNVCGEKVSNVCDFSYTRTEIK